MKKFLKKIITGALIGAVVAPIAYFLPKALFTDLVSRIESAAYDFRMSWIADDMEKKRYFVNPVTNTMDLTPATEDLLIVNIDDRSFRKYGAYHKWPRSYQGDLIRNLGQAQAAVVTYDVLYEGADFGAAEQKRILGIVEGGDPGLFRSDGSRLANAIAPGLNYDQMMVDATAEAGNVIHAIRFNHTEAYPNESDYLERTTADYQAKIKMESAVKDPTGGPNRIPTYPILDGAFPSLAAAARDVASVNVEVGKGKDGIQRYMPLVSRFNGYLYPSLAMQTVLELMDKRLRDVEIVPGRYINLGRPFAIRRREDGSLHVSFPYLTWPMMASLFQNRDQIKNLQPGQEVEVGAYVLVSRDPKGVLTAQITDRDGSPVEICFQTLADIIQSDIRQLKTAVLNEQLMLGGGTGVIQTEPGVFDLYELANNQNQVSGITYTTLYNISLLDKNVVRAVAPGKGAVLNNSFLISRTKDGRLTSPYVFLRGRVLEELAALDSQKITNLEKGRALEFGDPYVIPVDDQCRMLLTFLGPTTGRTFRQFSFYDVKEARVPLPTFTGKAIVVGSDAPALFDFVSTPVGGSVPGMILHCTAVDNILNRAFVRNFPEMYTFLLMLAISVFLGMLIYLLRPLYGFIITLLAIVVYFFANLAVMYNHGYWVEMIKPLLGIVGVYMGSIIYRYVTEEREKRFLNQTFKAYLSPELIEQMAETKTPPKLGGDCGIRTAYFTDIQGFSTFSEKLSASQLVELLNEYLTAMTDALLAENGTLDKYEGDAIIAFFGAPMPQPDHAQRACRVALKMQSELLRMREKWKGEGQKWPAVVHNMRMRIGINSGEIVTGNMGSAMRMNYTMMGDSVNLAARLESAAKQYGIYTMMSNFTREIIKNDMETRELDRIRVVGKSEPVTVFELLSEKGKLEPRLQELADIYRQGLERYYAMDWEGAVGFFTQSEKLEVERYPDAKTNPSREKLKACRLFQAEPPPTPWDGVSTLSEK